MLTQNIYSEMLLESKVYSLNILNSNESFYFQDEFEFKK